MINPLHQVNIRHLLVNYDERVVLDIPELGFVGGQITVLFGANGSGKTTLLHVMAGLIQPQSGTIVFDGKPLESIRHRIGIVLQRPVLFAGDVYTNIEYGLKCHGIPAKERKSRVTQALAMMRIETKRHATRRRLSGGEIQRVAIARTLALEPDLLLLDEVFTHLDQEGKKVLQSVLIELRDSGRTVILTSHDISGGLALADHTIILESGRLQPRAMLNAVQGISEFHDGHWIFRTQNGPDIEHITPVAGRGVASIAASDITLSRSFHESSARNRLTGTIISLSETGGIVRVGIELDGGCVFEALVTLASVQEMGLQLGNPIAMTFKASSVQIAII